MIIVGAKGLAKELLQIISADLNIDVEKIVFFDNISSDLPEKLYDRFTIINSYREVEEYLIKSKDKSFILGLGNPTYRKNLFDKFLEFKSNPITIISNNAEIGSFDVNINDGCSIMSGAKISNSVSIGKGCLIYYNCIITHDCVLGDFVEMSPNATILGRCKIGDSTRLGAGSIILPDVSIGKNVTIGAGAVVLNNIPDNSTVVGVPGRIIKTN